MNRLKEKAKYSLAQLKKDLKPYHINVNLLGDKMICSSDKHLIGFYIAGEGFDLSRSRSLPIIPADYFVREPLKIGWLILSKLKQNQTVFARSCIVKKVDKTAANRFLNEYHLMGSTQSAYNYGLYFKDELIALASFSKGRKMRRLETGKLSFELIRFCCKGGISVAGGLSRLVNKFCEERKAGDVMTYIEKQTSDGSSFVKAGFKRSDETDPKYFLIDKKTFERIPIAGKELVFDPTKFYLTQNTGNIKMIYTPDGKV